MRLSVLLACSSAFAVTLATARDEEPPPPAPAATTFAALDRNGDGRISRSEAAYDREIVAVFVQLDVDGDGFVSKSEFAQLSTVLANRSAAR